MIVLCYKDKNTGQNSFEYLQEDHRNTKNYETKVQIWLTKNPDKELLHAFPETADTRHSTILSSTNFYNYCNKYGLKESDFGREIGNGSHTIVGIKPNNRKYPILLLNNQTGQLTKATVYYVNKLMEIEQEGI